MKCQNKATTCILDGEKSKNIRLEILKYYTALLFRFKIPSKMTWNIKTNLCNSILNFECDINNSKFALGKNLSREEAEPYLFYSSLSVDILNYTADDKCRNKPTDWLLKEVWYRSVRIEVFL
jgi:hypothetical protein